MDQKISELDYFEVLIQLQFLENIANDGPLSEGNRALERELEERQQALIREKGAQPFQKTDTAASDKAAWEDATSHPEFSKTADALAQRHLRDDKSLIDKQKEDAKKFGPSKGLEDMHSRESDIHARHYDEERGRYAREFLEERKLAEELKRQEKGFDQDKGHEFSH